MSVKPLLDDRTVWLKLMAIEAICKGDYDEAEKFVKKLKANRELWERMRELK